MEIEKGREREEGRKEMNDIASLERILGREVDCGGWHEQRDSGDGAKFSLYVVLHPRKIVSSVVKEKDEERTKFLSLFRCGLAHSHYA